MSPTEAPQDKPHSNNNSVNASSKGVPVSDGVGVTTQGTTTTNAATHPMTAAPSSAGGSGPGVGGAMEHDLEVAQACLNLRQESKTTAPPPNDPHLRQGLGKDVDGPNGPNGAVGAVGADGADVPPHHHHPSMSNITSPPKGNGMDSRQGPPMMNPNMGPPMGGALMPPGPQDGRDGGSMAGPGRSGMPMSQVPASYIGVPSQIEFSGPNGYYNNVVDNSGHFYPQFPSEDQYHAMMGGMGGAMREMTYYNMMGNGQNEASNNMMPPPNTTHFFPATMMPGHEGGHFNAMMGGYPQGGGGGYMPQQQKRHPDEYSMQNDFKRSRTNMSHTRPEDNIPVRSKKVVEKKKGKRSSDMPRRPLSAYNFFFSEERERILAAIPDPVEKKPETETEKVVKDNSQNDGNKEEGTKTETTETKPEEKRPTLSKEEMHKKMAARSKRLLALREQQTNKRRPHRKTHGKIGFKELVKMIGERWRALPADQREYYAGLAETDLRRYKEQMAEYNGKLTHHRTNPSIA